MRPTLGRIVVLAGGVGAARFLEGLVEVVPPAEITVIGNTGDDCELHGLSISPDLDTVTYTLAGLADAERGWGIQGDTFACLKALGRFTPETWFQLGDRDLATHLYRTSLLRSGFPLSEATARLARSLGVACQILPMSDDKVRTWVETEAGSLDFQTYFVKNRAENQVRSVEFVGASEACPGPGVLDAIATAAVVLLAPSNPIISIGPILAVPGIREALGATPAPIAAISPIVGGRALKGPADAMMRSTGLEVSARQVAELYRDFLNVFVLDEQDRTQAGEIEALGMRAVVTQTIMTGAAERAALARATLEAVEL